MLVGGTEKLRGDDGVRRPARARRSRTRSHGTRPTSSSTSPTSRCSAPASGSRSPAARSRSASRTRARTSASSPPIAEPVDVADARGHRNRQARRQDGGHGSRRAAARRDAAAWSSWRWGGAGRPSPRSLPCRPRSTPSSSSRARAATRRPTISRRRSSPASPTVGCRRCGGGLAGRRRHVERPRGRIGRRRRSSPISSSLDGSGAALPPIDADRRVLVTSAAQPVEVAAGYLNAYRARIADLVLVTMAEEDAPHAELAAALRPHLRGRRCRSIRAVLRPRPLEPVDGERIAFFGTAPPSAHARLAAPPRRGARRAT